MRGARMRGIKKRYLSADPRHEEGGGGESAYQDSPGAPVESRGLRGGSKGGPNFSVSGSERGLASQRRRRRRRHSISVSRVHETDTGSRENRSSRNLPLISPDRDTSSPLHTRATYRTNLCSCLESERNNDRGRVYARALSREKETSRPRGRVSEVEKCPMELPRGGEKLFRLTVLTIVRGSLFTVPPRAALSGM